jgi:hypothetical protein
MPVVVGVVMLVLVQVGRGGEVAGGVDDTRGDYRGGGGHGYGGAGWLAKAEKQMVWLIQGESTVTEVVVLGHDVDVEYCWSSVDGRGRRESTILQLLL